LLVRKLLVEKKFLIRTFLQKRVVVHLYLGMVLLVRFVLNFLFLKTIFQKRGLGFQLFESSAQPLFIVFQVFYIVLGSFLSGFQLTKCEIFLGGCLKEGGDSLFQKVCKKDFFFLKKYRVIYIFWIKRGGLWFGGAFIFE